MARTSGQQLSRVKLAKAAAAIFGRREATISDYARSIPLAVLCETHRKQAPELTRVLLDLPSRAFERQPDDHDGNDVWSAGQVVSHLAETTMTALPFWEAVTGSAVEPPPPSVLAAIDVRLLDRARAVQASRGLEQATADLTTALLEAGDLSREATHFVLGTVEAAGALLATCVHYQDHIEQIETLGRTWSNW